MKFCTNSPQRMRPSDFGDPLTFLLAPPAGQCFHVSGEIFPHVLDGLAHNLPQIFMVPGSLMVFS